MSNSSTTAKRKSDEMSSNGDHDHEYDGKILKQLLDNVNPFGSYATAGSFTPLALSPKIIVEDIGTIGLPVHPLVAAALKEKAEKAPFGRGSATLLDESVRRAWQLDPKKVTVEGADWEDTMTELVKKASYELGISNENVNKLQIKANLYKALLYEVDGHFKPHKDTEKEDGMFGTLVIQLPSQFSGGASIVSHQGKSKTFESALDSEDAFRYTAFYADCEHEILPIESGWRFCLVYNLVVTKPNNSGVVPNAIQVFTTMKELQIEVTKWRISSTGKIGYPLDHEYTLDNFGFGTMKGRDAVVMSVLRNAVDAYGARLFELSLVIFFHKSYYGADEGDEEYGVEKILLEDGTSSSSMSRSEVKNFGLKNPVWVNDVMCRGKDGLLRELKIKEDVFRYGEADVGKEHEAWKEHHDAGNEGGGHTTWYRSACLIFLPASNVGLVPTVVSLCSDSVTK
mmetsp:Transcript_39487/g.55630  ORF Transcript_39487/g.55630 Transcript_39487/m.55630 type:complete len:455 (-) Transcript_39487:142-1506(-)|eukprot:CAMPEP_0202460688 /NCGR_PEP_ID=MMETSP1360-20130828/45356_1 /ASSEMBLY_ACC=CAM_ASM_000848 /TAXON_ID=515479 /ORGANISM="Licmophora paradoxa, Strain CCMP2313" /LENGTH=454 /DNA_ID=CAMNT_0049082455 /DNA_START=193 /DNA_END=1557 /DNA_ORIENTATION=+